MKQAQRHSQGRPTPAPPRNRAFTLIELLVVLAIIATLAALLTPALGRTHQTAYRVVCAANLRSVGLALAGYQQDHPRLPPQYDRWGPRPETYDSDLIEPWASYVAFHTDERDGRSGRMRPLQLAHLVDDAALASPKALYCPGQARQPGQESFSFDYVTDGGRLSWGVELPPRPDGTPDDKVRVSYHYWLHGKSRLSDLARAPVVLDNIQHWNAVGHRHRSRPHGINSLFGDGHVVFQSQPSLFDPILWNGGPTAGPWDGPGNDQSLFLGLLDRMRP